MDDAERAAIVAELAASFGRARDVSPASDQPLHVLLEELVLADGWTPSPTRALVRFTDWPMTRPDFFIDMSVRSRAGESPRSNSEQYVLGATWRQFSWTFPWPDPAASAVVAVQKWLCRFREQS